MRDQVRSYAGVVNRTGQVLNGRQRKKVRIRCVPQNDHLVEDRPLSLGLGEAAETGCEVVQGLASASQRGTRISASSTFRARLAVHQVTERRGRATT